MSKLPDLVFRRVLLASALVMIILQSGIFISLFIRSYSILNLSFVFSKTWDPVAEKFGALPFIIGTLLTSFLALVISLPLSISISILLGEYLREGIGATIFRSIIELLAGIPSVIYGLCGIFIFVPLVRSLEQKLGVPPFGVGIFTASVVLSIMIIPYSASIGREVIQMIPTEYKEAALSLGATKFEVIRYVVLPMASSGILSGIILSLGRALGETMAVTMVIGNRSDIPKSIFSPANTIASVIANEFMEASPGSIHLKSLIGLGLILFIVTGIVNVIGRIIIKRVSVKV